VFRAAYGAVGRGTITAEPSGRPLRGQRKIDIYTVKVGARAARQVELPAQGYGVAWRIVGADKTGAVDGAGAMGVSVGHVVGNAVDCGLGAPVRDNGGQGTRAAVPGSGTGALLEARYVTALAEADRCEDPLTAAENYGVSAALSAAPGAVVSDGFNAEVTGKHAARLNPGGWLVDEVVNFYMALLQDRDDRHCKADPTARPCHFFNSFFVSKLMGTDAELYSYDGVRRFTKKVDLYGKRLVVVPINVGNLHWTLAAVYMEQKTVRYYDSMGGSGSGLVYLRALLRYLGDEHQDKKGVPFDSAGWTMVPTTRNTPQQLNGFDCGVFASYCAHYVSLGAKPSFSQQHMPHLRRRMMADILDKKIHGS